MSPLPSKRRSELRAEAHKLTPVVIIGDKGLTEEVIAEVDRSLKAHELIKVRAAAGEREARGAWLETLCERLQAHAVQQIGKVFVLYRENPREAAPKRKLGPGPTPRSGARGGEVRKPRSGARGGEVRKPRSGARGGEARKPFGGRGTEERKPFGARGGEERKPRGGGEATGTSHPRSRTPSPRPASEPRRRRPRTSR